MKALKGRFFHHRSVDIIGARSCVSEVLTDAEIENG